MPPPLLVVGPLEEKLFCGFPKSYAYIYRLEITIFPRPVAAEQKNLQSKILCNKDKMSMEARQLTNKENEIKITLDLRVLHSLVWLK